MHILSSEFSQVPGIQQTTLLIPAPSTTIASPWLRPRLEGYRTAERGKAFDAKLSDSARVMFTVRLQTGIGDLLNNYQALLTVEQAPLMGQDPQASYPAIVTDVSGLFALDGHVSTDVALYGVSRVTLKLIRRTNPTTATPVMPLFCLVQVLGEEKGIDVEYNLRDRGES
jgi:hypothetical protein